MFYHILPTQHHTDCCPRISFLGSERLHLSSPCSHHPEPLQPQLAPVLTSNTPSSLLLSVLIDMLFLLYTAVSFVRTHSTDTDQCLFSSRRARLGVHRGSKQEKTLLDFLFWQKAQSINTNSKMSAGRSAGKIIRWLGTGV